MSEVLGDYYEGYYAQQQQVAAEKQRAAQQQAAYPQVAVQQAIAQQQAIAAQYAASEELAAQQAAWNVHPVPAQYAEALLSPTATPFTIESQHGKKYSTPDVGSSRIEGINFWIRGLMLLSILAFLIVLVILLFTGLNVINRGGHKASDRGKNKSDDNEDLEQPEGSRGKRVQFYQTSELFTKPVRTIKKRKTTVNPWHHEEENIIPDSYRVRVVH